MKQLSPHTEQEFVELVNDHQGIIHKVCSMYCDHEDERKDLFQEIILQLWRAFGSYKGESKFTTWMYRVALNTAISGFRKKKRRPEYQALTENEFGITWEDEGLEKREQTKFLYQAIEQLSEIEKAIVMLYLEDHSYDDIAQIMGITRNHVGVKLNRIKGKLKKTLVPHFGGTHPSSY